MDNFDMAVAVKTDAISRSAVLDELNKLADMEAYGNSVSDIGFGLTMAISRVRSAPALDVAPVVHGEFARLPEEVIPYLHVDPVLCKTCNTTFFTFNKEGKRLMLCPYCGARYSGTRMDGEIDA